MEIISRRLLSWCPYDGVPCIFHDQPTDHQSSPSVHLVMSLAPVLVGVNSVHSWKISILKAFDHRYYFSLWLQPCLPPLSKATTTKAMGTNMDTSMGTSQNARRCTTPSTRPSTRQHTSPSVPPITTTSRNVSPTGKTNVSRLQEPSTRISVLQAMSLFVPPPTRHLTLRNVTLIIGTVSYTHLRAHET